MVSKVANVVAAMTKMDIKVEWIDKVLGKVKAKRGHYALLQQARIEKTNSPGRA